MDFDLLRLSLGGEENTKQQLELSSKPEKSPRPASPNVVLTHQSSLLKSSDAGSTKLVDSLTDELREPGGTPEQKSMEWHGETGQEPDRVPARRVLIRTPVKGTQTPQRRDSIPSQDGIPSLTPSHSGSTPAGSANWSVSRRSSQARLHITPSTSSQRPVTPGKIRRDDSDTLVATVSSPALASSILPSPTPPLTSDDLSSNPIPVSTSMEPNLAVVAVHAKRRHSKTASGPLTWPHENPAAGTSNLAAGSLGAPLATESSSVLELASGTLHTEPRASGGMDENPFAVLGKVAQSGPTEAEPETHSDKSSSSGDKLSNPYDEDETAERKVSVSNSDVSNAPLIVDISPATCNLSGTASEPSTVLARASSGDLSSAITAAKLPTEPISKPAVEDYDPDAPPYTDESLNFDVMPTDADNPGTSVDFVFTPITLERMILLGMLICTEAALFVLTVLPIRVLLALWTRLKFGQMHHTQKMDVVKLFCIGLALALLLWTDAASIRHFIDSQSHLKLHFVFAMLQLFDRVLVHYLESVFAGLSWSLNAPRGDNFLWFFTVSVLVVAFHAYVLLANVILLDVTINGKSQTLFTVLITMHFSEIKSGVLKKLKVDKLFQLCCQDVIQRFYLLLFLVLVIVFDMGVFAREFDGREIRLSSLFKAAVIIYGSEALVDWLKHMSITTFNDRSPHIYTQFAAKFFNGMCSIDRTSFFADKGRAVAKELELFPLPLAVMVLKVLLDSLMRNQDLSPWHRAAIVCGVWVFLVLLKVFIHYIVRKWLRRFEYFVNDPPVGTLNKLLLIRPPPLATEPGSGASGAAAAPRKRYSFRLRAHVVLVTVFAIGLLYFAVRRLIWYRPDLFSWLEDLDEQVEKD